MHLKVCVFLRPGHHRKVVFKTHGTQKKLKLNHTKREIEMKVSFFSKEKVFFFLLFFFFNFFQYYIARNYAHTQNYFEGV